VNGQVVLGAPERLGHASIKTTLDTYGHLFDGLDEAAADRLDVTWHTPMRTQCGRDGTPV
jgi:hypothetical protein